MAYLDRDQWYDLTREVNWTPTYVTEDELYPEIMSGSRGIPMSEWETYEVPYRTSYPEYVEVQRGKDAGAYSVKAALERANFVDGADGGWVSTLKSHYGAIALQEYAAAGAEARMARFSKAPENRNMATFGMLDEMRHGQIQLYFPHEHTKRDRQWDWAQKAMHTNDWASIAARHFFADMMNGRDAISISIMLTFAFESGFTNMQFLGLAADAAQAGDHTFASLIASIQTDEARHAQQGGPALGILIANGKKEEAQRMVDVSFWRSWKLFTVLTGPMMDYYTPLEFRHQSFKEFLQEWIITQLLRQIKEMGLEKPWYWDLFLEDLEVSHHGIHMGVWYWRPTVWWNPRAGVSPEEREWLEEKYPGWNDSWGKCWDVMTENVNAGREDLTLPETLPVVCNMCNLPIVGRPGKNWSVKDYALEHEGRLYHFSSEPDRWCFQQDPERYKGHLSVIDRFLRGDIQPPDLAGALIYMGIHPGEMGQDATDYAWANTETTWAKSA